MKMITKMMMALAMTAALVGCKSEVSMVEDVRWDADASAYLNEKLPALHGVKEFQYEVVAVEHNRTFFDVVRVYADGKMVDEYRYVHVRNGLDSKIRNTGDVVIRWTAAEGYQIRTEDTLLFGKEDALAYVEAVRGRHIPYL